jgi:hypothetical protein
MWVVLNYENLRRRHSIYTSRWTPLRITGDVILVAIGAISGLMAHITVERNGPLPTYKGVSCFGWDIRLEWAAILAAGCLYAAWSLALIAIFGHDLVQTFRRQNAA